MKPHLKKEAGHWNVYVRGNIVAHAGSFSGACHAARMFFTVQHWDWKAYWGNAV